MTLSQSQAEKGLTTRPDDPVTESGLYARLQNFDTYNEFFGRKGRLKLQDLDDQILQETLIEYFYQGLHPE